MELLDLPVPGEGFSLRAAFDGPVGGAPVVLCHPHPAFGGTMQAPLVVAVARALSAAGARVLRFNFRGIGGSGGEPEGGLAEHRDVAAACAFLGAETGGAVALAGYSFGALMAARAIAEGLAVTRHASIAIPTAIIRGHEERIAHVRAAFAAQPTLVIAGTTDQFCDWRDLRPWADASPHAISMPLEGVNHFPTGEALTDLCARVTRFVMG